jgi:isopenicillin N synthase-like dioxygenase
MMDLFALALGLPDGYFAAFCGRAPHVMRCNNYQRHERMGDPLPGQMRMGAHSDYGSCTLLLADPVPGLQIVAPDGEWCDVLPASGAFLVNLGDLLAEWTNDRWSSTLHRVVPPPAGTTGAFRRRSIAFFYEANHDALVEVLPTCTSADNPPRYEPITAGAHLMAKLMGPRTLTRSDAVQTVGDRSV